MLRRFAIRFLCSSFKNDSYKQSKYYIPKESVQKFLNKMSIVYKSAPNGIKIRQCPFCTKPHNNDQTNMYTLNVHKETGIYHCFRCSSSGSYLDLKGRILGIDEGGSIQRNQDIVGGPSDMTYSRGENNQRNQQYHQQNPQSQIINQIDYFATQQKLNIPNYQDIKTYLVEQRGLKQETLNAYKVGAGEQPFIDENGNRVNVRVIYFPMFTSVSEKETKSVRKEINDYIVENNLFNVNIDQWKINTDMAKIVKCKIRGASSETKQFMRQYPSGSLTGFFGYNLVKEDTKQVVVTEGEFDAMSVYQQTGKVALSLPQGASHLPDQLVPLLDRFEKVILWMDNDKAGEINAPKIAHKMGIKRTFIVDNQDKTLKDANDVLRKNPDEMSKILESATTIPGKNILNFNDLRSKLRYNIFNAEKLEGIPSTAFSFYNRKLKGFRTGELSILSGGTGSGKTTLLSQLTLDFCQQGVGTLWGSFEIKNQILAYTMLAQYSKVDFKKHKEKFEFHAEKFTNLPLYWLSFHGSTDLEKVFGTIQYAIQKYDVSHVVIDTLQFLLSDQAEGFKKFDLQDSTISRLRRIATELNVHVTVVIHPKKVDQGQDLGLHSIFGSGKSVQEADNVLMIQQRQRFKILEVKKNRFDGQVGKIGIGFNKQIKSFFQLKKSQLQKLQKGQTDMSEVVAERQAGKQILKQDIDQILSAVNPNSEKNYDQFMINRQHKRRY